MSPKLFLEIIGTVNDHGVGGEQTSDRWFVEWFQPVPPHDVRTPNEQSEHGPYGTGKSGIHVGDFKILDGRPET